ncbi:MAG: PspC domain-containing protein [Bacteroidetes bacterium]|nr:PspC domain-containing protein [Bacteroidota bacterium]MBU1115527.1 PspC domain-containing protein [Bacteroidota bacterium]MBU1799579.1 PspC domain-containing protein [Bacteroidota bacterium]
MKEGITRSRQNRIFGGVAAGLAEYLTIDPLVARILFVVSVFFSGIGILLYLIMWIVIPEEKFINYSNSENADNDSEGFNNNINFTIPKQSNKNGQVIFGIVLIFIGIFFLGIEVFSFLNFEDLFPILIVGFGIYLVWNSKNRRG